MLESDKLFDVSVFGTFQVRRENIAIEKWSQGSDRLLAYLCLHFEDTDDLPELTFDGIRRAIAHSNAKEGYLRTVVLELLDTLEVAATKALGDAGEKRQYTLCTKKDRLGRDRKAYLRIDLAYGRLDLADFYDLIREPTVTSLMKAAALYARPLLEGMSDRWIEEPKACIERRFWDAWEKLSTQELLLNARARTELCHLVAIAKSRKEESGRRAESVLRAVLKALMDESRFDAAAKDYERLVSELRSRGQRLDSETKRLGDELTAHVSLFRARGSVPGCTNRYFPRPEDALGLRRGLLEERCPLMTLIGGGGVGKSRLAAEVCKDLNDNFPDGIWFVPLSRLQTHSTVDEIAQLAADTLKARRLPRHRSYTEAVTDYLVECPTGILLVFDNCEHVVESCAELVTTLLGQGNGCLQILATSREPLGLGTLEATYNVQPLAVPDEGEKNVGDFNSVRMFCQRAQIEIDTVSAADLEIVSAICRQVDGLPKAIELAAAQVKKRGLRGVLEGLKDVFSILASDLRHGPEKDRTMEASINWSYQWLEPDEKSLLENLSVFLGGWTLGALRSVCLDLNTSEIYATRLQSTLVQSSLIEEQGETGRCRMLFLIRAFASRKLHATGKAEEIAMRHAKYFQKLAVDMGSGLLTSDIVPKLTRLGQEASNLERALDWSYGNARDLGLATAAELWPWWVIRGGIAAGRARIDDFVKSKPTVPITVWAKAMTGLAVLTYYQSDFRTTVALADSSLSFARVAEDPRSQVISLVVAGICYFHELNEQDRARKYFDESLAVADASGDLYLQSLAMGNWALHAPPREVIPTGQTMVASTRESILAMANKSVLLGEASNNTFITSMALVNNALTLYFTGSYSDPEDVARLFKRALRQWREIDFRHGMMQILGLLGLVAARQGVLSKSQDRFERAATLQGAEFAAAERMGVKLPRIDQDLIAATTRITNDALDAVKPGLYLERTAIGRAMSLQDAVEYALQN